MVGQWRIDPGEITAPRCISGSAEASDVTVIYNRVRLEARFAIDLPDGKLHNMVNTWLHDGFDYERGMLKRGAEGFAYHQVTSLFVVRTLTVRAARRHAVLRHAVLRYTHRTPKASACDRNRRLGVESRPRGSPRPPFSAPRDSDQRSRALAVEPPPGHINASAWLQHSLQYVIGIRSPPPGDPCVAQC